MTALTCGMSLDEFWHCTPSELSRVCEARGQRHEHQQWMLAWHAANIMSMWSSGGVSAAQLMGQGPVDAAAVASSPEELMALLKAEEAKVAPAEEEFFNV